MPATWTWVVGGPAPSGTPQRELTQARGRVVTFRVAGYAYAQFTLDGRSGECAAITPRATDLWIYRNGALLFRGRIVDPSESITTDEHRCTFSAIDYRGMLTQAARIETGPPVFTAEDQGQIPWELIQAWQALDGADWGITEGVGAISGIERDETDLQIGKSIGEAIDALANRDNGFEWEISPTLQLNRWHPTRGAASGLLLDYGGRLTSLDKSSSSFGNAAVATGGQGLTPSTAETDDVTTDPRGRWSVFQGYPSVTLKSTLDDKAAWLRDQASTVVREWRAKITPERWDDLQRRWIGGWVGPDELWLGDTVTLAVKSGWWNFADPHRVVELQAVPGEDQSETINLGLVEAT